MKVNSKKISKISQQKGWTMWSLMFVLGVLGLFAYIGFQLVPVYSSNSSVKNAMQITIDEVNPAQLSRSSIIVKMRNQLFLDGSHKLLDFKKDLYIKRTQRELVFTVNYERRVPLFFNLSIVASLENEVKRNL